MKILEVDPEKVILTLESLNARLVFDGVLQAVFFDRGTQLRDAKRTLRVRTEGSDCIISVKVLHESANYKTSDEYEFSGSFDDAIAALTALGFEEFARSTKHRTSYRLPRFQVDIDRYLDDTFVPPFLEIEGEPEAIELAIDELDLRDHRCEAWSGSQLREFYALR